MQNKIFIYLLAIGIGLFGASCSGNDGATTQGIGDLDGFEITRISNSKYQKARLEKNGDGFAEEGYVLDGKRAGLWMTFQQDGRVKTIENYIEGNLDGIKLVLDGRGQIVNKEFVTGGKLHGDKAIYKYGRAQEVIPYVHGQVHGIVSRYYANGRVMERIGFVNGMQNGEYIHYNADEKIDMKYIYKDGEKVSGGMVE